MVITATRTPRSIKETPAVVTVITKEQIEASPAKTISDILLYEPGIVVQRPSGMAEGVPAGINIRGVPSALVATRTLILMDGIPVNATGTPFLIINEIPLDAIDRIEVVRGPYSNLYGANALGGVINVITKNAAQGFHGDVYGGAGNYLYREAGATSSLATGRFSYYVNFGARGIGNIFGFDSIYHRNYDQIHYRSSENYGYSEERCMGKFGYSPDSRTTITLHTRYFNSDLGYGKTAHTNPLVDRNTEGNKFLVGPELKMNVSDGIDVKLGGFFRTLNGKFYNEGYTADTPHVAVPSVWGATSNDGQANGQVTLRLIEHNSITAGFEILDNAIDFGANVNSITGETLLGAYGVKKSIYNLGFYLQDEVKYFDRLVVVGGMRIDDHSIFGSAYCPKIGASFKLTDYLRLRSSVGRAFRAPNLTELFMPSLMLELGKVIAPNPALKPEYVWTVDGGFECDLTKWVTFHADGFYNSMDNLISPMLVNVFSTPDVPEGATVTQVNIDKALSAGMESGATLKLRQWLSVFANYTYTWSEDEKTKMALDFIPTHTVNGGVCVRIAFSTFLFEATIDEQWTSPRTYLDIESWMVSGNEPSLSTRKPLYPSSYSRTDASVRLWYKKHLWLGIDALNLFNAEIEESGGTLAPGRLYSGRIGYTF
jgi:outer membrane cobalamin receptor